MEKKLFLVLIDCQNDFITGALRNEDAIKAIPNIVKKIRNFNGDAIFFTMDTHDENYLSTNEGMHLPVVHCVKGTEGWNLDPNVQAALDDAKLRNIKVIGIEKPTFGSFDLVEAVKKNTLWTDCDIEMAGFCTDICVISNALMLKAGLYEHADIIVDEKCCAGVTPQTHFAACKSMEMCQITIV